MNKETDPMDLLRAFAKMATNDPNIYSLFGGIPQTPKESPYEDFSDEKYLSNELTAPAPRFS